jgi:cyclopropane-fatty-acyl-phospholipid synthase
MSLLLTVFLNKIMHLPSLLAERRLIPDSIIRWGIRNQIKQHSIFLENNPKTDQFWIEQLSKGPIAECTETSKEQHYEVPTEYFNAVLGPNLKYSSCFWEESTNSLEQAEANMLKLSCERADLKNGQSILELGCGWGSLSLWMAEYYPQSSITAMSHSKTQKAYIDSEIKRRGLNNLKVITSDINDFDPSMQFDRIISVEMFEHLRNHSLLFERMNNWLKDEGHIFIHVFAHKKESYLFEVEHNRDWMAEHFFTGGIMPSVNLLPCTAKSFKELNRWKINGVHYSKTLEAWLSKQDQQEDKIKEQFLNTYGRDAKLWIQRWRLFYLACSELFASNCGNEWLVMHYLLAKR